MITITITIAVIITKLFIINNDKNDKKMVYSSTLTKLSKVKKKNTKKVCIIFSFNLIQASK